MPKKLRMWVAWGSQARNRHSHRTRRKMLLGGTLFGQRITGMGWEGDKFVIHTGGSWVALAV